MSIKQLLVLLPSRRSVVMVAVSSLVGAGLAIGAIAFLPELVKPGPNPGPPYDARFVAVGKAYLPQLGKAYAAAWADGAKELEAGKSISDALDVVSKAWSSSRTRLYDQVVTPEFSRIVAESVKDADVTPQERSALAAAWRGLSLGLGQ